jgi:YVTN family beta-propeller protein
MVGKRAVSYTLILTLVMGLTLSSTFLGTERAWADSVIKTIPVGAYPFYIAFNPTNNDMYVTNYGSNTVSVIDGSKNIVIDNISGFDVPYGIAFNPTNKDMYVTNNGGSNTVYNRVQLYL